MQYQSRVQEEWSFSLSGRTVSLKIKSKMCSYGHYLIYNVVGELNLGILKLKFFHDL